jgi:anthranilate phosphoribosyltransferase
MIREAIGTILAGGSLTQPDAAAVMRQIMDGEATPAQIAAFVVALRMKGETADEIAGLASAMRSRAVRIDGDAELDTCGTGGDGASTFNISTAAAFVAAGAGVRVAKHGNRAMSSRCGSADVLEALGVRLDLAPDEVERCLRDAGIGFLFAPVFHPAMKHAAGPRREIGVRTVFNILGPLCNPAGARAQLLGVAEPSLVETMAVVLGRLGCRRAMVVHGDDGLDEVTLSGRTMVCEVEDDHVRRYVLTPDDFGLPFVPPGRLTGGSAEDNSMLLRSVLSGEAGPHRDVVVANAAAAMYVSGRAADVREGARMAQDVLTSGRALSRLEHLVACCSRVTEVAA